MGTAYGIGSSSFNPLQSNPWGSSPFAGAGIGAQHLGLLSQQYGQAPVNVIGASTQPYATAPWQQIAQLLQVVPQQLHQLQHLTYLQQQQLQHVLQLVPLQLQQAQQVLQLVPQLIQLFQQQSPYAAFGAQPFAQPTVPSQPFGNVFQTLPSVLPQTFMAQPGHVM